MPLNIIKVGVWPLTDVHMSGVVQNIITQASLDHGHTYSCSNKTAKILLNFQHKKTSLIF